MCLFLSEIMVEDIIVPEDFSIFEDTHDKRRDYCPSCSRPVNVCVCCAAPENKLNCETKIIILKHPSEEKRSLTTVPLLQMSLSTSCCHVFVGVSFNVNPPKALSHIIDTHQCFLVYPSPDAKSISEVIPSGSQNCAFILLDASWRKARGLYTKNHGWLSKLQSVKLHKSQLSDYVIRTQPNDECVSTLEAASMVLDYMEGEIFPGIYDRLTAPLKCLCQHQLDHGAQKHDSKQRKQQMCAKTKKLMTTSSSLTEINENK